MTSPPDQGRMSNTVDRKPASDLHKAALIPADALPAWHRLRLALAGTVPPCAAAPERWFDRADPAPAIASCRRCPARTQCDDYANTARERSGVWGGKLRDRGASTEDET